MIRINYFSEEKPDTSQDVIFYQTTSNGRASSIDTAEALLTDYWDSFSALQRKALIPFIGVRPWSPTILSMTPCTLLTRRLR